METNSELPKNSSSPFTKRRLLGISFGIVLGIFAVLVLLAPQNERLHALGPMTVGHESMNCKTCHTDSQGTIRQQVQANVRYFFRLRQSPVDFGKKEVTNDTCLTCHSRPNERHPVYRFNEPRYAQVRAELAPQNCVSCHLEHNGKRVTQPDITFCSSCHKETKLKNDPKVLEKDPTSLSLFLGSDFPINSANKFGDLQIKALANIKETQKPQFFFNADIGSHSAMFSDIAVAQGCVDCHNKHPDSPKTDWKLNDIMGATTWSYPRATVSSDEIMQNIVALRRGFKEAYSEYLAKTQSFTKKPLIGDKWPKDGFYLPSLETFMKRIDEQNSGHTLEGILTIISQSQSKDIQKQGANL